MNAIAGPVGLMDIEVGRSTREGGEYECMRREEEIVKGRNRDIPTVIMAFVLFRGEVPFQLHL